MSHAVSACSRAALNYRHRQYRDTYPTARISDTELARRYRELQQHYDSIGSPSGRWRTHLLPGAERVFTTTEILHGLHALRTADGTAPVS